MKSLRKLDNPRLIQELKNWKGVDFRLETGKHPKLHLMVNGESRFVPLCSTPGDWRGKLRQVSYIRRTLISMGAERLNND